MSRPSFAAVIRFCGGTLLAVGIVGLGGSLADLGLVPTWGRFAAVPLPAAVALVGLGAALRATTMAVSKHSPTEDQRIVRAAALILILATGLTGLTGVAAL